VSYPSEHIDKRLDAGDTSAWCNPELVIMRIPTMSISQTDVMPIRSERSDARLSQCEIVIDISQEFCLFSLSWVVGFWSLTEGARRATEVGDQKRPLPGWLLHLLVTASPLLLSHGFTLQLKPVRGMHQPVENAVSHGWVADLGVPLGDWHLTC
jgi:hypothetical protein